MKSPTRVSYAHLRNRILDLNNDIRSRTAERYRLVRALQHGCSHTNVIETGGGTDAAGTRIGPRRICTWCAYEESKKRYGYRTLTAAPTARVTLATFARYRTLQPT